jgi:hypothetical protein
MRTFHSLPALTFAAALLSAFPASAQSAAHPSLPTGPAGGSFTSSGTYHVTSSSNDHGSALWVVDSVQHTVTLCEKVDTAKEFVCSKKPLP